MLKCSFSQVREWEEPCYFFAHVIIDILLHLSPTPIKKNYWKISTDIIFFDAVVCSTVIHSEAAIIWSLIQDLNQLSFASCLNIQKEIHFCCILSLCKCI